MNSTNAITPEILRGMHLSIPASSTPCMDCKSWRSTFFISDYHTQGASVTYSIGKDTAFRSGCTV